MIRNVILTIILLLTGCAADDTTESAPDAGAATDGQEDAGPDAASPPDATADAGTDAADCLCWECISLDDCYCYTGPDPHCYLDAGN